MLVSIKTTGRSHEETVFSWQLLHEVFLSFYKNLCVFPDLAQIITFQICTI